MVIWIGLGNESVLIKGCPHFWRSIGAQAWNVFSILHDLKAHILYKNSIPIVRVIIACHNQYFCQQSCDDAKTILNHSDRVLRYEFLEYLVIYESVRHYLTQKNHCRKCDTLSSCSSASTGRPDISFPYCVAVHAVMFVYSPSLSNPYYMGLEPGPQCTCAEVGQTYMYI